LIGRPVPRCGTEHQAPSIKPEPGGERKEIRLLDIFNGVYVLMNPGAPASRRRIEGELKKLAGETPALPGMTLRLRGNPEIIINIIICLNRGRKRRI
jgi:hypothetical protein